MGRLFQLVERHFKAGDEFIPALFAFEALNLFKEKGFKDFEDYDFLLMQGEYEKFLAENKEYRAFISKHFRCAYDVVKGLENIKTIKNDKRKSKRKK